MPRARTSQSARSVAVENPAEAGEFAAVFDLSVPF